MNKLMGDAATREDAGLTGSTRCSNCDPRQQATTSPAKLSRRDAIAKALRIAKRGEALEKRSPWDTLVSGSKTRHRYFADDLEAALAKEGYVIMPTRNADNVWPAIVNDMAEAFSKRFGEVNGHRGFYESFYAGYNAMIKVALGLPDPVHGPGHMNVATPGSAYGGGNPADDSQSNIEKPQESLPQSNE